MKEPLFSKLTRRDFIKLSIGTVLWQSLVGCGDASQNGLESWPSDQQAILSKIETLNFHPDGELSTTLCLRKVMWEQAQMLKAQDKWDTKLDDSDWLSNLNLVEENLKVLKEAGFSQVKLEIFPFELTQDGQNYNWEPLETALNLLEKNNLKVELCVGPLDFPYYPGIRLPKKIEDQLKEQVSKDQTDHIVVGTEKDFLSDYAFFFLEKIMQRVGDDPRIVAIAVANEYPDTHAIEGVDGVTLEVTEEFMLKTIETIQSYTSKKISLNTNIHPVDQDHLQDVFGPIMELLGEQGQLAIDTYPTQERKDSRLSQEIPNYGAIVRQLDSEFPGTEIKFGEFQAEPWLAGQSWYDIFMKEPELLKEFFEKQFPQTLETHMAKSNLRENTLWGAPAWLILNMLGYSFPLEMFKKISDKMNA